MADAKPFTVETSLRACWLKLITKCASGSVGAGAGAGTENPWPAVIATIAAECGIESMPRTRDFLRVANIAWFLPHVRLQGLLRVSKIEHAVIHCASDRMDAFTSAAHRGGATLLGLKPFLASQKPTKTRTELRLRICGVDGALSHVGLWHMRRASHVCVAENGAVFLTIEAHGTQHKGGVLELTPEFTFARFTPTRFLYKDFSGICADSRHIFVLSRARKCVEVVDRVRYADGSGNGWADEILTDMYSPEAACTAMLDDGRECVAVIDVAEVKFFINQGARWNLGDGIMTDLWASGGGVGEDVLSMPTALTYRAASAELIVFNNCVSGFVVIFGGYGFGTVRKIPFVACAPNHPRLSRFMHAVHHLAVIHGGADDGAVVFTCRVLEHTDFVEPLADAYAYRGHFLCVIT